MLLLWEERKANSETREHATGSRHLSQFGASFMNWLVIAVVGAAAAWFEFNYQRSRHEQRRAAADHPLNSSPRSPTAEAANVEHQGEAPSISPDAENDQKLNTSA
jgi:hypothetical protein